MLERALEISGHAQNFGVGVLRIGLAGQGDDVSIHERRSEFHSSAEAVAVGQVVERRVIIGILFQDIFKNFRAVIEILLHGTEPFGVDVREPLVIGIAGHEIVHGCDSGDKFAVLGAIHPADEEALVRGDAEHVIAGEAALVAAFFRVGGEVRECSVAQSEVRVLFHSLTHEINAVFNVEKIFAVHHAQVVIFLCLGGRGGDGDFFGSRRGESRLLRRGVLRRGDRREPDEARREKRKKRRLKCPPCVHKASLEGIISVNDLSKRSRDRRAAYRQCE